MNFYIMSKDIAVAKWYGNSLEIINENLVPLFFKNSNNALIWLKHRVIDSHRPNSRLLKRALGMAYKDAISTVLYVNGATITDNYWVKPIDSDLTYADVRFDNDFCSNLALTGKYDEFNKVANRKILKTPELTNTGSFEKCWKLQKGQWWMYKKANHDEMFSELFIYKLGNELGFKMAEYERGNGVIKTKDFTDNALVNFEPAFNILGDDEDYIKSVEMLQMICPDAVGDYVKMLFLDTICANPDRHTFNFGVLRDVDNGEILGLAPNFDNNMALISRGYSKNITRKNDLLIKLFNELMQHDEKLKKYIPTLSEEIIKSVIKSVGMRVKSKDITRFIMNGYNIIEK